MPWYDSKPLTGTQQFYSITTERIRGRRYYVAFLADQPAVSFRALRPEDAVRQLTVYVGGLYPLAPLPPTLRGPMPH